MSHFYGRMKGQSEIEITRCGSKNSGISAHISGWDVGVRVGGYVDNSNYGEDIFLVSLTRGSNNPSPIPICYVAFNSDTGKYRVETFSGDPKSVELKLNRGG